MKQRNYFFKEKLLTELKKKKKEVGFCVSPTGINDQTVGSLSLSLSSLLFSLLSSILKFRLATSLSHHLCGGKLEKKKKKKQTIIHYALL
jgi:hypothetical protein